ncbi:unnamed protein product [Owenia fusiformis]|uniref:Uncharacterized protein n=1 Tax=Owenia fusiformis TaxID=6347 RepID=A0A8J1XXJ2_OWEFU|nr:unnamed protein product [Owenia fusiformis]
MAAHCMGNFGAYKFAYSRFMDDPIRSQESNRKDEETVWVNKRYIPTDFRSTAPVPRYKIVAPNLLPEPPRYWVPLGEASLKTFDRAGDEESIYPSQPSSRCEEWSTLRQMLPSRGRPYRHSPPNWGTGASAPPQWTGKNQGRFPHINSPMTRYTDDMHLTNRLFKLH